MSEPRMPIERAIVDWMADEAAGAPRAFLEEILETTAGTTPQPRWRALAAEPTLRFPAGRTAVGLAHRGLVLAAVVGLLLAAVAALGVGTFLLLNRPQPLGGDWPGFRGDAARAGVDLRGPVGNPVVAWRYQATGTVLEIAAVGDRAYFASDDGTLHAVALGDGTAQWTVEVPNPPLSGPFLDRGVLYLSDSTGAVHAYRAADGTAAWTSATRYATPSRAVVADGVLYLGTGGGLVVALEASTGTERWRLPVPGATRIDAPAVADGRLFAGSDGGFVAIDVAEPRIAWLGDTNGELTGSAAVADGIAYIGAGPDPAATGTLRAFDAATGRLLWTAVDMGLGIPSVADGVAYTAGIAGRLYAIDTTTGETSWGVDVDGDTRTVVVVGGTAYLTAGGARQVVAIDTANGAERWHVDLDADANCCVSVAKGLLLVGTQGGSVYAIRGDGKDLAPPPVPSPVGSPVPSSTPQAAATLPPAPLPSIGAVAWTTALDNLAIAPVSQIAVDPTTGLIWVPEAAGDRIAIFDSDGHQVDEWGEPGEAPGQFDFTRRNGDGYGTVAFAPDGSFFVLDVGNLRVQHFDAQRRYIGEWGSFGDTPRTFKDPVGIAVDHDGTVWVLDDVRSVVEHYTADGVILGSFDPFAATPVNQGANSLAIDADGNLYVSEAVPAKVDVFDQTGRPLRSIGEGVFAEQAGELAVDADGRVFVSQGPNRQDRPGVLVFDADGTLLAGFGPTGIGDGQLAFPGGIALDGAGGLYVEDSWQESSRLMRVAVSLPQP